MSFVLFGGMGVGRVRTFLWPLVAVNLPVLDTHDAVCVGQSAVIVCNGENSSARIFRDLGEHGRFVERFVVQSWAEYVRSRQRMTLGERRIQERVEKFQREGVEIRVSRLIAINPEDIAAGPQPIPPAPPPPAHAKETAKASAH